MIVTAWKGGTYGLKVTVKDRDIYFKKDWKSVVLYLNDPDISVKVNIDKPSFWNTTCHELISNDIRIWLIQSNLALWPEGEPPKFFMEPVCKAHFLVCPIKCGLIEAVKKISLLRLTNKIKAKEPKNENC